MKPLCLPGLIAALLALPLHAQDWDPAPAEARLMERASLAYGTHFAQQFLEKQGLQLDVDQFVAAFRAVAEGKPPLISDEDRTTTFTEMSDYLKNRPKWEGLRFLFENESKEGVKSTPSGLQYLVLKEGEEGGSKPSSTSQVTVHYTGKLIHGEVFDSSVDRGEPAIFSVDGVIAGWTEGLQLMTTGSKFRFFIPYQLAYREAGSPPKIPGYSTLVFDVELLGIGE